MLMDEPFGAIDPIARERLQNEFLRLQSEIRKTVLFVTHDIDEAIKMGDRIAILKQGGHLAQFATPAELLMAPADDFVEDFVGADRALKRLALMRVSDIDLWEAPLAFVGQATSEVKPKLHRAEVPHALLVDSSEGRWAGSRSATWRETSCRRSPTAPPSRVLDRDDVMRDALADLLQAETRYAPVVDARGAIAGVLSVEIISEFLASPEALSRRAFGGGATAGDGGLMVGPDRAAAARRAGQLRPRAAARGDLVRRATNGSSARAGRSTTRPTTSTPTLQHLVLVSSRSRSGS